MVSRSYANLLDLSAGDMGVAPRSGRRLPRVMTVAGIVSSEGRDDDNSNSVTSDAPSSLSTERIIIVAHMLPLLAQRKANDTGWTFSWDEDSLVLQLKDGLPEDMEVIYIGCLKVEVELSEQDEVASTLLESFNCVPAFLPAHVQANFYHGFCKQLLWPLFHYMLPLAPDHGGRFDRSLWQAYVSANKLFADKVMEVISPEDDFVWVHDYHLLVLPTFLRRRFNKIKLGFFLHSPFPSSEIYRTLPVRDEILRALLNADLVGFHTFDYARHFLSCCSRMLGLVYESRRGYMGLEYYGRTVGIKIMPVGIHMGQLNTRLKRHDTEWRIGELRAEYAGKTVLLGVDDMDIFKGIGLKLLAMEQLLKQHPQRRGKVVLVQIVKPARGRGKDVLEIQNEASTIAKRINREFGWEGYQPVVLLERSVPLYERLAFYAIAECCVVTAVRDGMNLHPYEYIVSRQGCVEAEPANGASAETARQSMLVVSEFIGCSPSLSGAIRVNPWNIEAMADALNTAITMPTAEKHMRHEKHFKYVSTHDVAYWAQSFMGDLERTCRDHQRRRSYGIGFGLSFKVVALDPNFRKLLTEHIVSAYGKSQKRTILLDYDGTMITQTSHNKTPNADVITLLNTLCNDPKNSVFIVSGRGRKTLSDWFSPCERLGIAAEHGYYYRWKKDEEWTTCVSVQDFEWKEVAAPVMNLYTESTDGSIIEEKESAIVWHYRDADPDFGSWQAKELLDHLESVLANEPVAVKSGQHIVEVKPQGVSKGVIVEKLLSMMAERGSPPDFVLCVGDDRSDEDMFESIATTMSLPPQSSMAEVFACTVGQKPSKAKYYLDDTSNVLNMLQGLAVASDPGSASALSAYSTHTSQATLEMHPEEGVLRRFWCNARVSLL
ncbi:hypothetical protein Mapa_011177 [Marchantia paleacea]|nr:hypothetical protein Mapa_011177 [Marchantia paleacea]